MQKISWKKIIFFITGLCLLIGVGSVPFYSSLKYGYQYRSTKRKIQQIEKEKDHSLDVVFLGDSECWSAFAPIQLFGEQGVASYNCATTGQWAGDSKAILKQVLKTQTPSVVVLGTSTLYNSLNQYKYLFTQILPVFHYHGIYKDAIVKAEDASNKGANLNQLDVPYSGRKDYMSAHTKPKMFKPFSQSKLEEIQTLCNENGIPLVLVSSPSALTWSEAKHKAVAQWCTEHEVPYYDYNEADMLARIEFDWRTDTRDGGDHVNLKGSKKVTSDLGKVLVNTYALPDHRNDPDYAEWKQKYSKSAFYQGGK